jgi:corrinoid protein of di/trimethylamine methyltransferase
MALMSTSSGLPQKERFHEKYRLLRRGSMSAKAELLKRLSDAVFGMEDEDIVVNAVKEYIKEGYDAREGMLSGLVDGMKRASELYETGEYFVPELIVCSDAMYAGIGEFQKYLPKEDKAGIGKIAIGVVEGDTHDIGKNLVRIMLETGGFDVHDLGRDVPLGRFVEYAGENRIDIICMSSLMTTTMPGMKSVIEKLKEAGIRDAVKVMIGGAPVSSAFAEKIGADGYSRNAIEAVKLAQELIGAK